MLKIKLTGLTFFLIEFLLLSQTQPCGNDYGSSTDETNIITQERDNALVIPRAYLIGDTMVMLVDKSTKRVELGLRDYQKAEIRSGITSKDVLLNPIR